MTSNDRLTIGNSDGLEWARHPKSSVAMHAICVAAARDSRLAGIVAELREQGVCDDHGKLLKRWDAQRGAFVAARS